MNCRGGAGSLEERGVLKPAGLTRGVVPGPEHTLASGTEIEADFVDATLDPGERAEAGKQEGTEGAGMTTVDGMAADGRADGRW